jgi:hypothetical protein
VSPTLVLNPRHDTDFMTLAEAIMSGGIESPGQLQERLRQTYPNVIVRARDLNGEAFTIWYVYRDGHWISGLAEPSEGG